MFLHITGLVYSPKRTSSWPEGLTAPAQLKVSKIIFKRVWGNWHWYFFVAQWCLLDQNSMTAGQPFSLYLGAKSKIYSITQINTLPTIGTAISIVCALSAGLFADRVENSGFRLF
jgi:ACS family pantothenate transporter-like MFS transporter